MGETGSARHGSANAAIILIGVGVIFLILNLWPNFHPWALLEHYWPVLLIVLGLGKLLDSYAGREYPGMSAGWDSIATVIVLLAIVGFAASMAHWGQNRGRNSTSGRDTNIHESQSVDLQSAQSVTANIQMPSGTLELNGGSSRLLDANFSHSDSREKPNVAYTVANGHGQLDVSQNNEGPDFGRNENDWKLNFGTATPLDLSLHMGAGQSDMKLAGLNVTNLNVQIGAGEMNLDLTGDRKTSLQVDIHGGVGAAKIRLPKDVGVRVHASGGIGSVETHGLRRDGDAYVNDAYGKTASTITINIQGGIGDIRLDQEP
jgi:N-terminal domain of toast_rack, DUF2154